MVLHRLRFGVSLAGCRQSGRATRSLRPPRSLTHSRMLAAPGPNWRMNRPHYCANLSSPASGASRIDWHAGAEPSIPRPDHWPVPSTMATWATCERIGRLESGQKRIQHDRLRPSFYTVGLAREQASPQRLRPLQRSTQRTRSDDVGLLLREPCLIRSIIGGWRIGIAYEFAQRHCPRQ